MQSPEQLETTQRAFGPVENANAAYGIELVAQTGDELSHRGHGLIDPRDDIGSTLETAHGQTAGRNRLLEID